MNEFCWFTQITREWKYLPLLQQSLWLYYFIFMLFFHLVVFIPNKIGGSLYPCNRMISCFPCWTFSTNSSSGASMSSQRNRMINRSCIPGGMMPLSSTMGFTITRNFEQYGLLLIWNLAGMLLMFCSVTVFYNNVLLASFTLLWFSNFLSSNFNFNFVFKEKYLIHLLQFKITKLNVIRVCHQYFLLNFRSHYTFLQIWTWHQVMSDWKEDYQVKYFQILFSRYTCRYEHFW